MEWRCKWCGKPHAANEPPCDNCGHGRFEKAVVRMGPDSSDEANPVVWACTECGREHQKHSPPCSRCGNATLQQRDADYSDLDDVGETGWLDILDRRYAAGFAVVGALGLVLGLGMAGVVDLPVLGGPPSPPEAPGQDETADGVSLAAAEDAFVVAVNEDRERAALARLDRGETLDSMATYYTKRRVDAAYADAEEPTLSELDPFTPNCAGAERITVLPYRLLHIDTAEADDAATMGETVADEAGLRRDRSASDVLARGPDRSRLGIDIHHAPGGDLFVTVVAC